MPLATAEVIDQLAKTRPELAAVVKELSAPRRFFIPDIDRHPWIVDRLTKLYGINERQAVGWLRGITESSEFLFLYSESAAGLAEVTRQHTLAAQPVLTVRFVWCRPIRTVDGQVEVDKKHFPEALLFFDEFAKWAKNKNISTIVLEADVLDVPREMIRETKSLGRLFRREQWFAKVS